MKKPEPQPTTCRTRPGHLRRSQRPGQRWGQTADRNDANAHTPNRPSTHEPTDIGDQYLNAGARTANRQPAALKGKPSSSAVLNTSDFSSMCQKRAGRSRSTIRNTAHRIVNGNAIQ